MSKRGSSWGAEEDDEGRGKVEPTTTSVREERGRSRPARAMKTEVGVSRNPAKWMESTLGRKRRRVRNRRSVSEEFEPWSPRPSATS